MGSILGIVGLGKVTFEIAAGGRDITTLSLILNPWDILLLTCSAVALSVVAAAYPARNAAKLDPVLALRRG